MPEYDPQYMSDFSTRLKDIEEKQKLAKDRLLLIGKNLVDEREQTFNEIQTLKKEVFIMKEELARVGDLVRQVSEQMNHLARKEELQILKRQFEMIRPALK